MNNSLEIDLYLEQEVEDLRRAEYEAERYIKTCKERIKQYESKLKEAEARIKKTKQQKIDNIQYKIQHGLDNGIIDEKSIIKTQTQMSYVIPSAKFIFKISCEIQKNEDILFEYLKENKKEYITTKEVSSINWREFKKTLTISNGNIVNDEGEILEIGLQVVENESFDIKYL